jgi:hypothetical protein
MLPCIVPRMERPNAHDWANSLLDGDLPALLKEWRAAGLTIDSMRDELRARDVEVSRELVRQWANTHAPKAVA